MTNSNENLQSPSQITYHSLEKYNKCLKIASKTVAVIVISKLSILYSRTNILSFVFGLNILFRTTIKAKVLKRL